jgi:hypothetical protein
MYRRAIAAVSLGLLLIAQVFALAAFPAGAADHLDAPGLTSPGSDGRIDINDVYAFQSPSNPNNAVLIMTVNPGAGVISGTSFRPGAAYQFLIDTNGDAKEDWAFTTVFYGRNDNNQRLITHFGRVDGRQSSLIHGGVGRTLSGRNGVTLTTGVFDDPFFFDLNGFLAGAMFCQPGSDFFNGLNTSAIVIEFPRSLLPQDNVGVWARTFVLGMGQVDRMGRPAINTVFIPNNPFEPTGSESSLKNSFNAGQPRNDQAAFRAEVVDSLALLFSLNDPPSGTDDTSDDAATVQALADILLPDILTVDFSSSAGFLNGRRLADDVIDAELALITEGAVTTDCIDANNKPFLNMFPYLAARN